MDEIVANFKHVLKNWQNFSGRARRKEFWQFVLALAVLSLGANIIDSIFFGHNSGGILTNGILAFALFKGDLLHALGPIGKLLSVFMVIPLLAVAFRRLHDVNRSAWWLLIYLIPLLGWIIGVYFMCKDSDAENVYGTNPKQIG